MNENEIKPVEDASIHHAVNFHPEDYEVLDYLDNQPPRWEQFAPMLWCGEDSLVRAREQFEGARKHWGEEMDRYFPFRREEKPSIYHCTHCGNGLVRYIVAVRHNLTGQNVVFGSECVARLGFANQSAFKAAQLRAKAEAGNKRMAAFVAREKFLAEHPDVKAAIEDLSANEAVHKRNDFARDILSKFNHYGGMSERQMEAFVASIKRDHEFAAKRAAQDAEPKGEFPTGRVEFTGEIIRTREQESDWGTVTKVLLKIVSAVGTNCKVWMTLPSGVNCLERGHRIVVKAGLEQSKDDKHFGFGKRPHLVEELPNTVAA